jgi:predicted Rossmann fold flavoprotein
MYDLIVIGGGAAGVFGAIWAKSKNWQAHIVLLEKTQVLLAKVRISGGGRCNVTHACFDTSLLVNNYPRGSNELRGPFSRFQVGDTINWFAERGVVLKPEEDGHMFPLTDRSDTIIDCLRSELQSLAVEIVMQAHIQGIIKNKNLFEVELKDQVLIGRNLLLATGSSREGYLWAQHLGHTLELPVPSLFTFNVPQSPLKELSGITLEEVGLHILGTSLRQKGALLITHFGFSGPAVLKLSACGARLLHERKYQVDLGINWLPQFSQEEIFLQLINLKAKTPHRTLAFTNPFFLPKNLWKKLLELQDIGQRRLNDIAQGDLRLLAQKLHADCYRVAGKTTHKEEFVTCGGISLKEVNFKTMQSKLCPGLFFAGEILDIDGITGGFNFQSAWTTGYIAGTSIENF